MRFNNSNNNSSDLVMDQTAETINSILSFFGKHPISGTFIAIISTAYGSFAPYTINAEIPLVFMQIIQIFFWIIGGAASTLTIISWCKKHLKK